MRSREYTCTVSSSAKVMATDLTTTHGHGVSYCACVRLLFNKCMRNREGQRKEGVREGGRERERKRERDRDRQTEREREREREREGEGDGQTDKQKRDTEKERERDQCRERDGW